jgi:hypothetical protein
MHQSGLQRKPRDAARSLSFTFWRILRRSSRMLSRQDARAQSRSSAILCSSSLIKNFRTQKHIPHNATAFYFETMVVTSTPNEEICIGLAENRLPGDSRPGQSLRGGQNFGYSSQGALFNRCIKLFDLERFQAGDVVGLGVNFIKNELFVTRNGRFVSKLFLIKPKSYHLRISSTTTLPYR